MAYIDSRRKLFGHMDRLAIWQNGGSVAPVTVEWDLSNRCALGCMDCHFAHTHTRGPWTAKKRTLPMAFDAGGDLADENLVISGLREMDAAGVLGVVWSGGGEPTTHPRWEYIIEQAAALGLKQGMYTLGGLLNPSSAALLGTVADWVVVSLDAPDANTYAVEKGVPAERFGAATRGIEGLVAAGSAVVGVSFLLHEDNWYRGDDMLSLARELGATYTTFRPAIRTSPDNPSKCYADRSWITDAIPKLLDLAGEKDVELDVDRFIEYRDWDNTSRKYSVCHGIKLTSVITPDGRVWVCPQRRGCQDSCLGDLKTESFKSIWGRHSGRWTDFSGCRVMCRLHLMNETLDEVFHEREHGAFL